MEYKRRLLNCSSCRVLRLDHSRFSFWSSMRNNSPIIMWQVFSFNFLSFRYFNFTFRLSLSFLFSRLSGSHYFVLEFTESLFDSFCEWYLAPLAVFILVDRTLFRVSTVLIQMDAPSSNFVFSKQSTHAETLPLRLILRDAWCEFILLNHYHSTLARWTCCFRVKLILRNDCHFCEFFWYRDKRATG